MSLLTYNEMLLKLFNFRFAAATTIKLSILKYIINNHKHVDGINKLSKYIPFHIAVVMEEGILEYTMAYISSNDIEITLFTNIYNDVINTICANIDSKNKRVYNKIFLNSLLNNTIDPYTVAFMTPQQINPTVWMVELTKQNNIDEASKNIKVTDLYKCNKCGDRKSTTTQIQTRSADEPMTVVITCLTCYTTYTT
jgi:DNA-directed RNA polymerase subunit M/transcription elongation factor TFIIS